ncbi:hypothetical protein LUZ61_001287 [Rhynchospora tenuis]|uniref:Beta-amylase n=1 Tax=Rhynchospora tenuis TaxID=198213 RepID=A0AAD5ZGN5_9POAL|nr:hypothetical protein LUZ61_001287 [Rhynchospora tenuis]
MEVSLSGPKVIVAKLKDTKVKKLGFSAPGFGHNGSNFGDLGRQCRVNWVGLKANQLRLKAIRAEIAVEKNQTPFRNEKVQSQTPVELLVGLPLDTVSKTNTINHEKAISAGLRALKLMGAYGVELPVFWAVAQPNSPDEFDWSPYLAVADMARCAGLHLRVSLHLNGCHRPNVLLPGWVLQAADADPDILFKDKSGALHKDCLSFAVDELPVLHGRKPVEVFESLFRSFSSTFKDYFGSTITEITVSLGANGELRYPSFPPTTDSEFTGVGEFQCYDKYSLSQLKQAAESAGNPLWGLGGPHDAPKYNESPNNSNFFKDHGGSWDTPYGNFFLSWYSQQLVNHGDRLLSIASNVFGDLPVQLSAKVPLLHHWHEMRSRPAELTAGFYNSADRDGYGAVTEIFAKYSCMMIIPGMDELGSNPESLLHQIKQACERHGVQVSGENSALVKQGTDNLGKIKENVQAGLKAFTYQRMGADFFSPEHWPLFREFVRGMERRQLGADDLPEGSGGGVSLSAGSEAGNDREMQAA